MSRNQATAKKDGIFAVLLLLYYTTITVGNEVGRRQGHARLLLRLTREKMQVDGARIIVGCPDN
jgi:hypothetical protein